MHHQASILDFFGTPPFPQITIKSSSDGILAQGAWDK